MAQSPRKRLSTTHVLWVALLCGLTACTSPKLIQNASDLTVPSTKALIKTQQNQTATHLSSWSIIGVIAAKQKNKAWSASFTWTQRGANQYHLFLFGPLGGGTINIEKKGSHLIYQNGQKTITSNNPEQLFAHETGFHLPIHYLYYWIRGLAAPQAPQSSQTDQNGHLIFLNQAGYTLHYTAYTRVNQMTLPTKIQFDSSEGTVKLVIKQWQTPK